jgi:hypothetical protein
MPENAQSLPQSHQNMKKHRSTLILVAIATLLAGCATDNTATIHASAAKHAHIRALQLGLTPDQESQLTQVYVTIDDQSQAIFHNSSLTQEQKTAQFKGASMTAGKQMHAFLTPTQEKQLAALRQLENKSQGQPFSPELCPLKKGMSPAQVSAILGPGCFGPLDPKIVNAAVAAGEPIGVNANGIKLSFGAGGLLDW